MYIQKQKKEVMVNVKYIYNIYYYNEHQNGLDPYVLFILKYML